MDKEKILRLKIFEDKDDYGDVSGQELFGETDLGKEISYFVHDLCECPEDATVERSLFSAYDYIEALELGMKLAEEGYTDIEVFEEQEN